MANGGASLTLRHERAPFPTVRRTVWLPWNVFHVMDTVVMKREANDIPSCYLTGLIRPHPQILATPLSTFYKSSPEDSPIVPETQVRTWSPTILFFFFLIFFDLTECRPFLKSQKLSHTNADKVTSNAALNDQLSCSWRITDLWLNLNKDQVALTTPT